MDTLAVIAIITSLGSLVVIFGKTIKKSSCCGSNCETRTPQPSIIMEQPKISDLNRDELTV